MRRPIVAVLGSGTDASDPRAAELGRWLAEAGVHLLTGGGAGVMGAVSRAFGEVPGRSGLVIGVLPARPDDPLCRPPPSYPNPWVELVIRTHLPQRGARGAAPMSRNHINVLTADVSIALAGGAGTASEVQLALRYRRPVVAWLEDPARIPELPPEVPVERELRAVGAWLRARLGEVEGL